MNEETIISQPPAKPNQKYEKFLNDVYTCIRQKQCMLKRSNTPDNTQIFPKLNGKETVFEFSIGEEDNVANTPQKVKPGIKTKKFRSFLNILDEHQKKISNQNMNLLGLEVKKIIYSEKVKSKGERQLVDLINENSSLMKQTRMPSTSHLKRTRKTIDCERIEDFECKKMGLSHREIITMSKRPSMPGSSKAFYSKDKPKTSKPQKKRKSNCEVNPIYEGRINSYRQLLFKLQYIYGVYSEMEKDVYFEDYVLKNDQKYRAWIGSGNNGALIKSLIKKRFWWIICEEKSFEANFIWTQLKNNDYYKKQDASTFWRNEINKNRRPSSELEKTSSLKQKSLQKRKNSRINIPEQEHFRKLFNLQESGKYKEFYLRHGNKSYLEKYSLLGLKEQQSSKYRMHNHLINNFYLGNKKALFYNLKQYYDLLDENVFRKIPLTFHIKKGFKDIQYKRFVAYYKRRQLSIKKQEKDIDEKGGVKQKMRNVWIVKPGQLTNRGNGITVIDEVYELNHIIKRENQHENGTEKTFIVQLYIDRPFLYQKRKFDIRHFILITQIHGLMRAYWYNQGYLRTASYEFDIECFDREIHLTNDAVQKYTPLYGKYEPGNKISYSQFQRYLHSTYPKKKYSFDSVLRQMKEISIDSVKSSYLKISPHRLKHNFEIFGLDFMIDYEFKPWLIEVNTNPCLEISCPLLAKIIPEVVDQALKLSLDVVYPPPCNYPNTTKHLAPEASLENLNFQLIFDEKRDGTEIRALYKKTNDNLLEEIGDISEDQVYQQQGINIKFDEFL